jgi:uncharacterized SAM-binding protein YcdF (DUF218 family)
MKTHFDAIIIPGGGLTDKGELTEWARRRFDKAVELFSGTEKLVPLSRWTTHRPTLVDEEGFARDEAVKGAEYLIEHGVPPENILIENFSFDTIGNAFFTRVVHTDPGNLRKLCIVTSAFHIPRTKEIFTKVFALTPVIDLPYELDFVEVTDEGLDLEQLENRIVKEQEALAKFKEGYGEIETLSAFHSYLFQTHKAYAAGKNYRVDAVNKLTLY